MLDIGRDQRSNGGQHEREGQRGRDDKQTGRPARQNAGSQRRDAKEDAAEDIADPDERNRALGGLRGSRRSRAH